MKYLGCSALCIFFDTERYLRYVVITLLILNGLLVSCEMGPCSSNCSGTIARGLLVFFIFILLFCYFFSFGIIGVLLLDHFNVLYERPTRASMGDKYLPFVDSGSQEDHGASSPHVVSVHEQSSSPSADLQT
jgi:hypothetical protein